MATTTMTWEKLFDLTPAPVEARPFKVLRQARFWLGYEASIVLASERGSYRVITPDYTESFRTRKAAETAYAERCAEMVAAYGLPLAA
jgi:hypothetical protein